MFHRIYLQFPLIKCRETIPLISSILFFCLWEHKHKYMYKYVTIKLGREKCLSLQRESNPGPSRIPAEFYNH